MPSNIRSSRSDHAFLRPHSISLASALQSTSPPPTIAKPSRRTEKIDILADETSIDG
jgi:hypothetical protein